MPQVGMPQWAVGDMPHKTLWPGDTMPLVTLCPETLYPGPKRVKVGLWGFKGAQGGKRMSRGSKFVKRVKQAKGDQRGSKGGKENQRGSKRINGGKRR